MWRWRLPDFVPLAPSFKIDTPVQAFSPNGAVLIATDIFKRKPTTVWDVRTGQKLHTLASPHGAYQEAAFSPDGSRAITLDSGMPPRAQVWDTATWKPLGAQLNELRETTPSTAQFAPAGPRLVTLRPHCGIGAFDADATIQLWNTNTMETVGEPLRALFFAWSDDGTRIVTGNRVGDSGFVQLWDTATARRIGDPIAMPSSEMPSSLIFSPSGRWLAVGLKVFDVDSGEPASVRFELDNSLDPKNPTGPSANPVVTRIAWRPDSRALLASASGGASIFETCAPVGVPPDWLRSLIEVVSGETFNTAGSLTAIPPNERVERMRALPLPKGLTGWDRVLELWRE